VSLLRRIEQGQNGQGSLPSPSSAGDGKSTGDGSRLAALQGKRVSTPVTAPQSGSYYDLKTRVQNKLLSELDPATDITKTDEVRRTIQALFEQILTEE